MQILLRKLIILAAFILPLSSTSQEDKIIEIMENCLEMEIPSKVDLAIGNNWGEAK